MPITTFGWDPAGLATVARGVAGQMLGRQAGGGGFMQGLSNLFQNKLFLQLLAAGGADIMQQTGGKNILGAITENIAAQNLSRLLGQVLGSGGKLTIDTKGINMTLPSPQAQPTQPIQPTQPTQPAAGQGDQILQDMLGQVGQLGQAVPTGQAAATAPISGEMLDVIRTARNLLSGQLPFQPDLSGIAASDLAGLSTQDILQALTMGYRQAELGQKSLADIADMIYKGGLLEYYGGQLETARQADITERLKIAERLAEALRTAPIPVPGVGEGLSLDAWKALPDDVRAFAYAAFLDPNIKDFNTWKAEVSKGERIKLVERAMRDPAFRKTLLELEAAGATRITLPEKLEEKAAVSQLTGPAFFDDPNWTTIVDKIEEADDDVYSLRAELVRKKTEEGMDPMKAIEEARREALLRVRLRKVEGLIVSAGGKVADRTRVGNTYTWVVDFPPIVDAKGTVLRPSQRKEIRYVAK